MLKKRLIPKFLLRDGRLVKYVRFFENERAAGNPVTTAKVYNDYGVDELIVLDIVPSEASRQPRGRDHRADVGRDLHAVHGRRWGQDAR